MLSGFLGYAFLLPPHIIANLQGIGIQTQTSRLIYRNPYPQPAAYMYSTSTPLAPEYWGAK